MASPHRESRRRAKDRQKVKLAQIKKDVALERAIEAEEAEAKLPPPSPFWKITIGVALLGALSLSLLLGLVLTFVTWLVAP